MNCLVLLLYRTTTIISRNSYTIRAILITAYANALEKVKYTWSQIQVTKVHKDTAGKLAVGDIITILENEAFDAEYNTVYHLGGYNMMVPERSYLLFLTVANLDDGSEYYVSSGINCGTVSLENDGRSQSYINRSGSAISDFSIYESLWEEAKDKYIGQ